MLGASYIIDIHVAGRKQETKKVVARKRDREIWDGPKRITLMLSF